MRTPELFQGEKYLNKNAKYFEGWYFKNVNKEKGISFIPGINIDNKEKKAFIQVITKNSSYFVDYDIRDFEFCENPFYIKIKNNFFSKENIVINIRDEKQNLNIYGKIKYSNHKNIHKTLLSPNIMGPFSYIPLMECNHAILSMKSDVNGLIDINNTKINFNNGYGYIEKDWGCSFPKAYIWCQGNNFPKADASFMLSIADIPFTIFNFRGIICVLKLDSEEFKFTTYNNTKILKYDISENTLNIILKKADYYLEIHANYKTGNRLLAPVNGKMEKDILESISLPIDVTLRKKDRIIFSDRSSNCGMEVVLK